MPPLVGIAPPQTLLAVPRGVSGIFFSQANLVMKTTSSVLVGWTTASGTRLSSRFTMPGKLAVSQRVSPLTFCYVITSTLIAFLFAFLAYSTL